jgi:hypothetical protein
MLQTYKAILHGDHVEWIEKPPEKSHPAQVHITFLEETVSEADLERGQAMAEALAALIVALATDLQSVRRILQQ